MRNERSPYARIIPPSSVGAAHEMIVAADLIKRGFDVYRSVSASSRADIIIVHGARMLRVEVTTGVRNMGRNPKRPFSWPPKVAAHHDILAVVLHPGTIHYSPEPPSIAPKGR